MHAHPYAHAVCGCRTGADLLDAGASPHPPAQAGCLGRQVQACSSAKDPERRAQAVPSSRPWQMFPVSQQGAADLISIPGRNAVNKSLQFHLAITSRIFTCKQKSPSSSAWGVQLILFVGQPLECKKQMKEGGEERGSASKLCSAPELAVLNLSDFPSKPPLCGE